MFTGLIEALGCLRSARSLPGGKLLRIDAASMEGLPRPGDSVSVNGVCLTVAEARAGSISVEAVGDSLRKTTLATLLPGRILNLERAMRAEGRFDGHLVQGHVNALGGVLGWEKSGVTSFLSIALPERLSSSVIREGSIAVDGVSLTVAGLDRRGGQLALRLSIIPLTAERTNLAFLEPRQAVNVETDILLRSFARGGEASSPGKVRGLDKTDLTLWGYA